MTPEPMPLSGLAMSALLPWAATVEAGAVEHDVQLSPMAGEDSQADGSEEVMSTGCILSDYIDHALAEATYDKLDDGSFAGRIPPCKGVVAFGVSLVECQHLLRSILEDWLFLGLKLGHPIPVLSGIDLNEEPTREPLDAV